ncbi:MAG: hypothetical protein AABY84_12915 [Candidatus Firestonebacteria bacterium]
MERFNTIIVIFILFLVIIASFIITETTSQLPLIIFLASIVLIITFLNTDVALIILIFSMLLSPELKAGAITSREVALRIDDIFLLVISFGWFAKMAVFKKLGLLKHTPLNFPILVYIFICIVSTCIGLIAGEGKIIQSIFYNLKYIEYFLLFFIVVNNIHDINQIKLFIRCLLLTCLVVAIYAWWEHLHFGSFRRVSAPFEGKEGEANTLAGYLLLMMAIITALAIYSKSLIQRVVLSGLLSFIILPFIFTFSRGAWIGFYPMYISMVALTKKAKYMLLGILIISILLIPSLIPKEAKYRVKSTFTYVRTYAIFGKELQLDEAIIARLDAVRGSLEKWYKRPLLGYGVPGFGAVGDNQYIRVLRETGIIGFIVWSWLIIMLYKSAWKTFKICKGYNFAQGLSLGFIAGLTGLLIQSLSCETFILIRIMEPFWFLAAIVVVLPEIYPKLTQETQ